MNYGIYYVFITALISSYEDMIIAGLVKAGFQVSSLAEDNTVTLSTEDSVCAIIALRIDVDNENAFDLQTEIQKILKELKVIYYSLIVTESVDCAWNISNIKLPKALPPSSLPNVRKPDSSMN